MIEILDRHHGQVTGMFSGDECLAGRSPLQGTELCAVVEFLYSLEHLFSVFGDPSFADRLERVAFNALPATFAPDMWSHQYDQQVNQVQCTVNPEHLLHDQRPRVEPLRPRAELRLLHREHAPGLAEARRAPVDEDAGRGARGRGLGAVPRRAFASRGVPVAVAVDTDYPFRETLAITVRPERAVRFPLVLRVPAWAEGATVSVGRRRRAADEGGLAPPARARVERRDGARRALPDAAEGHDRATTRRSRSSAARSSTRSRSARSGRGSTRTSRTASCRTATSRCGRRRPGTTASSLDPARPEASLRFEERPVGERPFSPEGAGMSRDGARRGACPGWKLAHGWAGEISRADPAWAHAGPAEPDGPVEEVRLIPYGCTNIRITEFPRTGG